MSLWSSARNTLDVGSATIGALQIFDQLTRSTQPDVKAALGAVRVVVIALVEGYQGKIRGVQLNHAIERLGMALREHEGVPTLTMLDEFQAAL